jgi:hypothetical protein
VALSAEPAFFISVVYRVRKPVSRKNAFNPEGIFHKKTPLIAGFFI